jgi:hypothetical protein
MFGLSHLTNHDVNGLYSHSLCLSSHSPPTTFSCIIIIMIRRWSHQEKKTWIWASYLGSIPTLTTAQERTHPMWAMPFYPHSAFNPTERNQLSRLVFFLELLSIVGPGGNLWMSILYFRNEPRPSWLKSRLFLRKQPNQQRRIRTLSSYQDIWLLFYLDILLFLTFSGLVVSFLSHFGINSGYPGFRRFWHKNGGT